MSRINATRHKGGFAGDAALDAESLTGLANIGSVRDAFPDMVGIVLEKVIRHPMPDAVTEPLRAVVGDQEAHVSEEGKGLPRRPSSGLR